MKCLSLNLKRLIRFWSVFLCAILVISIGTGVCVAHKINVFAMVEKDSLVVEGYFSGKVKAQGAEVQVYNSSGAKVATGHTDSTGVCKIDLAQIKPVKGDLKVVIMTGDGHRSEYTVKSSEIPSKFK